MPASISTLFCTGAVTSAAKAPVAQASAALPSIASTARAFAGSGWPGDHRHGAAAGARLRRRRPRGAGAAGS